MMLSGVRLMGSKFSLKCAEVHEGELLVTSTIAVPFGSYAAQGRVQEMLMTYIPHQDALLQVKIDLDVE
jgi:hypothetical protein